MSDINPDQYRAAQRHGSPVEIAPDVFVVTGSQRMAPLMTISRLMVVVREGSDLTLINAVRMTEEGEAELEALGNVRHVMRIGAVHGCDDPYVVARFGATFWCQPRSKFYPDPPPDKLLEPGGALPISNAEILVFEELRAAECVLLLRRGKGLLVTCDSLQHYGEMPNTSLVAKLVMKAYGFHSGMQIGPIWRKRLTKEGGSLQPDFERIMQLDFDALVSAHGNPIMSGAKAAVRAAIDEAYSAA